MPRSDPSNTHTRPAAPKGRKPHDLPVPTLTLLCHPAAERVGERVVLTDLLGRGTVELSRKSPAFAPARGGRPTPLEDPFLSRSPFTIEAEPDGGVELIRGDAPTELRIDGKDLRSRYRFSSAQLEAGAVLELAERIVLLLHYFRPEPPISIAPALIGDSNAIYRTKREIEKVADLDISVLLRGESGTGKELVARAIHDNGPRRERPYLAANLGAIPKELAAAELFGAAKGAFTGAHRARRGFFERAEDGTLFLDEIGIAPPEVQALLLRVLETREIQPVGGEPKPTVARVISATDADLDSAVDAGEFRSPLLHRLSTYEIFLPPLRDRRDDFGRLFFHFLHSELEGVGEQEKLGGDTEDPWISAELIALLARLPWSGNVRQLRNVARQIVVASRGRPHAVVPPRITKMLADAGLSSIDGTASPAFDAPRSRYRSAESVTEDELIEALEAEAFRIRHAADRLGVSRTAIYRLMDECPRIRKASELGAAEILDAIAEAEGDIDRAAASLAVSARGLRLRITELGLVA